MTLAYGIEFATVTELFECKLTNGVKQPVPGEAVIFLGSDQRFVDEAKQLGVSGDVVVAGNRGCRGGVETAGEYCEPTEHDAFGFRQTRVGPINRGTHRLMPGRRGARPAGEQAKSTLQ